MVCTTFGLVGRHLVLTAVEIAGAKSFTSGLAKTLPVFNRFFRKYFLKILPLNQQES